MDHFGTSHLGGGHHISEQIVYYPQPDHPISGAVPFPRTSGPPPYSGPSMSVYAPPPRVNGSGYPPNYGMTQRHSVPPAAVEEFSNYGGSYRGTLGTDIGDADFSGCDSQYSFGVRPLNLSERRGTSVDSWRGSLQPRHPSTKMYSRGPERFYPPSDVPAGPRFPPRFTHSGYSPRGFRGSFAGRSRRGGLNPGILDSDAVPRRPVSPLYCELCKVSCAGPKAFGEHQNGQRHKKRIAQNEAIERLQKTSDGAAVLLKTVSPSKIHELRCDLCDVGCTGAEAYAAHLAGKAHQRTLRLHRDLGKPIPETEPVPVSSTVAKPAKKAASKTTAGTAGPIKLKSDVPFNGAASSAPSSNVAAASATTLPQSTDASIVPTTTSSDTSSQKKDSAQPVVDDRKAVGAEFIDVITGSGGKGAHYRCNLCECQFTNADAKELHLKGRRHRVQYKKKVDSTLVIEPKSASVFHKKVARNERPSERGSLFPPPRPGGSAWTASIGTNDQMPLPGQPFGRFDFRNQAPTTLMQSPPVPFPEMTIENRYMGIKHSQIIPTELEAKAMKTAVSICEHALKDISDNLLNSMMEAPDDCFENTKSDSESDQDASCSPREKNADKSCFPSEEDRFLRGVVRIGSLGKCLLLRGDHEAHLALVCAEWPTTEAVNFVHEKLTQRLMSLDHRFAYDVSSIPPKGLITIRVSREEDADEDTPNEEDTSPETLESVATQQWPTIIVHIQFTSSVVGEAELVETETNAECFNRVASGAVKADGERPNEALNAALHTAPEQPSATTTTTKNKGSRSRGRPMFAHGERVDKISCLDALDAIDQAKWFQCALTKSPLGLVSRILVDFMRANELWLKLDQFAVLAYLDRLLTLDLQATCPPGPMRPPQPSFMPMAMPHPRMPPAPPSALQTQQPFCPLIPGRMHPSWIPPTIGPARLLRRFFEAVASGLLLQLKPESKTNDSSNASDGNSGKSHPFFAFTLLSRVPLAVREELTVSAQFCLRQIAFRQLYKVLRMEQLSSQASRKGATKEQLSTVERANPVGSNVGAVKRRRLDDELNPDDDVHEEAQSEEESKVEDQSDELASVVNGTHNEDRPKDDEPETRTSSEKEVHVAEPTPVAHSRFNAKRGRRGR